MYRIRDWDKHFENNRSREVKRLSYVVIPNNLDGAGYTELVEHKNGAAHYACWVGCVIVASRCDPRGTLLRGSARPHDAASLSRITRIPEVYWKEALPRLVALGWLECIDHDGNDLEQSADECDTTSQDAATFSRNGATHTEGNRREQKGKKEYSACAERVYALYPRKIGKGDAIKSIERALKLTTEEVLTEAVTAFAKSPAGNAGKFTPHPATWFNQRRWEDDRSEWNRDGSDSQETDYSAEMARRLGVQDA